MARAAPSAVVRGRCEIVTQAQYTSAVGAIQSSQDGAEGGVLGR